MQVHAAINMRNPSSWPKDLRRAVDAIAVVFMHAFRLARGRALAASSPVIQLQADRDGRAFQNEIKDRMLGVFRRSRESIDAYCRPVFSPEDRFEILQIMRLMNWTPKQAAKAFVLHPNTIRNWEKRFLKSPADGGFFGPAPFNKISDAARWLIHEIRRMCPTPDCGTRTIANLIVKAGVQLSRPSVQRILRERPPKSPARKMRKESEGEPVVPYHLLAPRTVNRVWHMDLTVVNILWVKFYVAAVVDGFSRRLLALNVFPATPTSIMMRKLVQTTAAACGAPRFLITNHGCQFRKAFTAAMENKGVTVVKGAMKTYRMNGKCERFFRTFKLWTRVATFAFFGNLFAVDRERMAVWMQRRLDVYRDWYNNRVHQGIDGRTPNAVWSGKPPVAARPCRAHEIQPEIKVLRRHYRGDLHLPVIDIEVDWPAA